MHFLIAVALVPALASPPEYAGSPPNLIGVNNPVAVDYLYSMVEEPALQSADGPPASRLYRAATHGVARPTNRSVVFQIAPTSDDIAICAPLKAGNPPPDLPRPTALAKAEPPIAQIPTARLNFSTPPEPKPDHRKAMRIGLLAEGGGLLLESAVAWYEVWAVGREFTAKYHGKDPLSVVLSGDDFDPTQQVAFRRDQESYRRWQRKYAGFAAGACVLGATALTLGIVVKW